MLHEKIIIIAKVRKVGSIGIFYDNFFELEDATPENYKDKWFDKYSNDWELLCFRKFPVKLNTVPEVATYKSVEHGWE